MKMIKAVMAGAVTMALVSFGVNAADQGHGVVNFKGTVIDAPCSIAPESADQSIDFGQISKSHLNSDNGISIQKNVDIKLMNCDLSDTTKYPNKKVTVAFSGNTGTSATELLTSGSTGTAVVINGYGADIDFTGKPTGGISLVDGSNTLRFSSWVKKASGVTAVTEGDFSAITNFTLAYN